MRGSEGSSHRISNNHTSERDATLKTLNLWVFSLISPLSVSPFILHGYVVCPLKQKLFIHFYMYRRSCNKRDTLPEHPCSWRLLTKGVDWTPFKPQLWYHCYVMTHEGGLEGSSHRVSNIYTSERDITLLPKTLRH